MMFAADDEYEHRIEDENYFVSMTDMMVGLVFIFIILLMYFALQLRVAEEKLNHTTHQLISANQTRTEILESVQRALKRKGLEVSIDVENGVLRLPDEILFDSARADLKPEGIAALRKLAEALAEILPCYTDGGEFLSAAGSCQKSSHHIESLFIEGHTDKDPLNGAGVMKDNWDLSVVRATNTYRALVSQDSRLESLCVRHQRTCSQILSVSGYGDARPAFAGDDAESKARNRRIDLRILMQSPRASVPQRRLELRLREDQ
jgi:chemotaxis protein MotB